MSCREPAVVPECDRNEEYFPSQMVESHPAVYLPEAETENVPVSVFVLYQIAVTYALNDVGSLVAVGENRVPRAAFKVSPRTVGAGAGNHVTVLRAALRRHEVIDAVDVVHMRAFEEPAAGTLPDAPAGSKLAAGEYVDLALHNAGNSAVVLAVAQKVHFALIEEQGGIYTALIHGYRVRPFAVDIVCPDIKIFMCGVVRSHKIETSVVKPQCRRENSAGASYLVEHDLFRTCQCKTYLRPVHQIVALKQRYSGKILKRACRKVIFTVGAAYGRIRVEPLYYRISICH